MTVAIIGVACRLPGSVASPADCWKVLESGQSVITEVPDDRWTKSAFYSPRRNEPGKSYSFAAGILDDIRRFDAEAFGLSPREAEEMDPQQRLLLEVSVEALEDAGYRPSAMAGRDCGVYVGISAVDYGTLRLGDPAAAGPYFMTGSTQSIAANRISYALDLHGPSFAIDTACSSSLFAFDLACTALGNRTVETALVGGVNLLLSPYPFIGFSRAGMLSPDGRCRPFDADGRGYVRAEGSVVMLLKALDRAIADGDRILGVVHATGTNADGRTSGLALPNADAQAALLRRIYGEGGIDATALGYVEAHGTGTPAGDPLEASAIGEVLGRRRKRPLPIGSAKGNFGHLEPVSGLVGVLKALLVLKHRRIPPTACFVTPNPRIPIDRLNLELVSRSRPLTGGRRALIGVNSFGFGGANAHAVIGAPPRPRRRRRPALVPPLFLSAHDPAALQAMMAAQAAQLAALPASRYYDVAYRRACHRDAHIHRAVVWGANPAQIRDRLDGAAAGGTDAGVVVGHRVDQSGKVGFVFSGNGAQWAGMGRDLLAGSGPAAAMLRTIDGKFAKIAGWSIVDALAAASPETIASTAYAQPMLFAVQLAAAAELAAAGLTPDGVVGHSVGEIAAAFVAGCLTLDQAIRVIYQRSRAQEMTRGQGRMASVGLSADAATEIVGRLGLDVTVACLNSPANVTLSGDGDALARIGRFCSERRIFFRALDLDYAFHSPAMEPVADLILTELHGLEPRSGTVPFASSVTGGIVEGRGLDRCYWWANIRKPVRFVEAVERLIETGVGIFLEIGPAPVLQGYLREILRGKNRQGKVLATLTKNVQSQERLHVAAFEAHTAGAALRLDGYFPVTGNPVDLPRYPWQGDRHWFTSTPEILDFFGRPEAHPLLGHPKVGQDREWERHLDLDVTTFLRDHEVDGAVVFPAAGFAEVALAAARETAGRDTAIAIEDLEIFRPLALSADRSRSMRVRMVGSDGSMMIETRPRLSDEAWTLNAACRALVLDGAPPATPLRAARDAGETIGAAAHYETAAAIGLHYGPAFRTIARVTIDKDRATFDLVTPDSLRPDLDRYVLHPAFLDGAFQVLFDVLRGRSGGAVFLPARIGRLAIHRAGTPARGTAVIERASSRAVVAGFELFDATGALLASARNCRFKRAEIGHARQGKPALHGFHPVPRAHPDVLRDAPMVDPGQIAAAARAALGSADAKRILAEHRDRVRPLLDALATAFAWRTLFPGAAAGDAVALDDLSARLHVDPASRALFDRLLRMLVEDGLITVEGEVCVVEGGEAWPSPEDIWRLIVSDFPAHLPEALLLGRAGLALDRLLAGAAPDTVLGRGETPSIAYEHWASSRPTRRPMLEALEAAIGTIAAAWPPDRPLRIVEIGDGRVELARALLRRLPPDRYHYTLAVHGDGALARTTADLGDRSGVTVCGIDLDRIDETLAIGDATADIVIATDALHRCIDANVLLRRVRRILVQHGLLLAIENCPDRFSDIAFGGDPGWWRERRSGGMASRLLEPRQWQVLVGRAGFAAPPVVVADSPQTNAAGCALLIAVNPSVAEAEPAESRGQGQSPGAWLLLARRDAPEGALASRLAGALARAGLAAVIVEPGADAAILEAGRGRIRFDAPDDVARILAFLEGEGRTVTEIVHLVGLEAHADDPVAGALDRCNLATVLARGLIAAGKTPPRLWFVTAGGADRVADGTGPLRPAEAALRGFARVLKNEIPDFDIRVLDLQYDGDAVHRADRLLPDLMSPDIEDEIVVTATGRWVPRLQRQDRAETGGEGSWRLDIATPGALSRLRWRAMPPMAPDPGEIQVKVRATGLNFRDVMWTMGLLDDEALESGFAGATLGMECAGDVVAVGQGVEGFAVGDRVLGFAPACFAEFVTAPATALAAIPDGVTYEAAATIPSAFFTAYYALHHLGRLQPGERVLIHGAAGAVGLAAIQMARHLGAEIFGTAGSDEKRDMLRLLGVDHVLDSRSLAFAEEIERITGGEGVDLVLNSLAGEAMVRSLALVRPFGRFLELGKRDFYANSKLGLRPFRNNVTFFGIDADQVMAGQPALMRRLFGEILDLFREGALRPLVHRVFGQDEVVDAFRQMQQSRHIGKIVVRMDGTPSGIAMSPKTHPPLSLDPEGLYLVTGGLGGFGLATAQRLAARGARHLLLLGRRGAATPEAEAAVATLTEAGVTVSAPPCDIADMDRLRPVLAAATADRRLRGIVHAAMVLDDGIVANLSAARLETVFRPKIAGAWNLHRLTADLRDLDFFVLYSSVTTVLGNPGQAAYVGANLYLEQLAAQRVSEGLPGLAVAWGPIADAGYLTRNLKVGEQLSARVGRMDLTAAGALDMLEALLADPPAVSVSVADLDGPALRRSLPSLAAPKYAVLRRGGTASDGASAAGQDFHAQLAGKSAEEAIVLVRTVLTEQVGSIMRIAPEKLDLNRPLTELGMDSLMAVELRHAIETTLGVELPVMEMSGGGSLQSVAEKLLARLSVDAPAAAVGTVAELSTLASRHAVHGVSVEAIAADMAENDPSKVRLIQ
jgi:phthiocerol/phenolphthiocerol synthesis type-I polyketide synthase C